MNKEQLKRFIYSQAYDTNCQDIEILNRIGHSMSYLTWDLIKDIYDWKNKNIVDLGCFHGYYCFKIEQLGGNVAGFDRSPIILSVASSIRDILHSNVRFNQWELEQPVSKAYDIALLISVLRYANNKHLTIQNIGCKYLLCDVADDEVPIIEKYYTVLKRKESWGKDKRNGIGNIMLCERKNYV